MAELVVIAILNVLFFYGVYLISKILEELVQYVIDENEYDAWAEDREKELQERREKM